ncbi:hypothetical protein PHPALM_27451, partial [Phytophthora palmivora]
MATTSPPSPSAGAISPKKAGMPRRQVATVPLDYSFMGLTSLSVSLRVNNNKISRLDDMQEALCAVFDYPAMLQWLDLSGNVLESIPPNVFSAYPDLFTLHLHGNLLNKYSDVDALA